MKEKPNEKYNNPQDEEEIRVAKATLGYFHLKTSSDYVVPEHLRSNTRQKRRKIANMTIQIYNQKKVFNEKVRKARDEKIAIRSEIISLTDQISKVSSRLTREFKLMLARWRSQPIKYRVRERQPITEQSNHLKASV